MTTTIPDMMTAISIVQPGGPDMLVPEERAVPAPGDTSILVAVEAAGVNRPDVLQRMGGYPPPPGAPDIPGLEIAGTVVALGRQASRWSIGDKVTALVPGGGYAQFCAVEETNALPIPAGLSTTEAAALPETFFTVWSTVFDRGGLQPGESFLVHGGTSGIGTTAIQLAKAFGAKVITTAGSEEKCKACLSLGADLAINYQTTDFAKAVKQETDGKGVDVILDMVAGDYVERNWKSAAVEGRIVQLATLNGPSENLNFGLLMVKRLHHTGATLRPRDTAFKAAIADNLKTKVWPLIESGAIKPIMDSVFPLTEAAKAHARMESSQHIGKIVLEVG